VTDAGVWTRRPQAPLPVPRAPRERRILVGEPGVDAERIDHPRMNQLAALVERAEFFTEASIRARPRRARAPRSNARLAHAGERRQPCPARGNARR
jgi:hypothetical protein